MIKVIVAGSRDFNNYPLLEATLDQIREEWDNEITVVSGCARGADKLGERYAQEHRLSLDLYPAEWEKFGKPAGYRRNVWMAENADALVAFRVGKSKGTTHMINIAMEKGLRVRVVDL